MWNQTAFAQPTAEWWWQGEISASPLSFICPPWDLSLAQFVCGKPTFPGIQAIVPGIFSIFPVKKSLLGISQVSPDTPSHQKVITLGGPSLRQGLTAILASGLGAVRKEYYYSVGSCSFADNIHQQSIPLQLANFICRTTKKLQRTGYNTFPDPKCSLTHTFENLSLTHLLSSLCDSHRINPANSIGSTRG